MEIILKGQSALHEFHSKVPFKGTLFSGFQDFSDDGTSQASPIVQSHILGGKVKLTNNNGGVLTDGNTNVNATTTPNNVLDLWKSSTNTFEFKDKGLNVNDTFSLRFSGSYSPNTVPSNSFVVLDFYDDVDGTGNLVFSLRSQFLSINNDAGVYLSNGINMNFFLGESIKDGSMEIHMEGTTMFSINVIGSNIQINTK